MFGLSIRANRRSNHVAAFGAAGGGGGTRAASAAFAHGCLAGESRAINQNRRAATRPSDPYRTKTPRQFCAVDAGSPSKVMAANAVRTGATTPPIRPPNPTALLSRPRSSFDAHRRTSPAAAGYAPASHAPKHSRTARSAPAPAASDVAAVQSDQATMATVSTARGPYRSASDPTGIWNRA